MTQVSLRGVSKAFDDTLVIPALDLDIANKEFVVLVGPSGCGKTTTLRMLAGLESVSGGKVLFGDRDVTDLRPGLRNCSMVFQNYALYPHMTVAQNIGYGMKVRGVSKDESRRAVEEAARVLDLTPYLDRRPKNLSGGQRQRVAIGRAIVRRPDVFLFDEPLSNLDAKLRIEMRTEIKALHRRLETTIVYVTHDQVEAMTMADRVVVMNQGRIEQAADPVTLYERPANRFVASFIGAPSMNFIKGELGLRDGQANFIGREGLTLPFPRALDGEAFWDGQPLTLGIRPEHVVGEGSGQLALDMAVRAVEPLGAHTLLVGEVAGAPFTAQVDAYTKIQPEQRVSIALDRQRLHWFDSVTEKALRV